MRTGTGLLRFIVVGFVLLLAISVGAYFLFRAPTSLSQDPADVHAIYQVVGEFGARLKYVEMTALQQTTISDVRLNLTGLITDRLYHLFMQDMSRIPGRYPSRPWPERIEIISVQKLDTTTYRVHGNQVMMTSDALTQGGNAGETPITLTVKRVGGTWLVDDVAGGTQPKA